MTKRIFGLLVLIFSLGLANQAFADEMEYTDKELNEILLNADVPMDTLLEMDYDYKLNVVKTNGEDVKFEGRESYNYHLDQTGNFQEIPETTGGFTAMGVIPTTSMKTSIDVWSVNSTTKTFYSNFEWIRKSDGIRNDRLGMALPSGWTIDSNSFECATYSKVWSTSPWGRHSSCGGRTASQNVYGADWIVGSSSTHATDNFYKGFVKFRATKNKSTAVNKVVANYAHDNKKGASTIGVSIGALSVTHRLSSGSMDTAGYSKTW